MEDDAYNEFHTSRTYYNLLEGKRESKIGREKMNLLRDGESGPVSREIANLTSGNCFQLATNDDLVQGYLLMTTRPSWSLCFPWINFSIGKMSWLACQKKQVGRLCVKSVSKWLDWNTSARVMGIQMSQQVIPELISLLRRSTRQNRRKRPYDRFVLVQNIVSPWILLLTHQIRPRMILLISRRAGC